MEFAFGMNQSVSDNSPLVISGTTLVQHGMPTINVDTQPTTVNYTARFVRRRDWVAAGLTYSVQFSADLTTWQTSTAAFTLIAQDATHEAISVPYPFFVNGRKARFFRVVVTAQ